MLTATGQGTSWSPHALIITPESDGRYCLTEDLELLQPGAVIVYVVFVAYNDFGESVTEHGNYYGEGHMPVPPCP